MSDFEINDPYADAAAEERDRSWEWRETMRHWAQQVQDDLTRDSGEHPYFPKSAGTPAATHSERVADAGYELDDPKGRSIP